MGKPRVDWSQVRLEYISSLQPITLTELAEKNGLARMTVNRKAVKEGWKLQRDLHIARTAEQTTEKLEGVISDEGAKFDSEMFLRIKSLLVRMDTDIKGAISDKVVQAFSDVFRAWTLAQGVGKAALGDKGNDSTVAAFMVALETVTKKKATNE